MSLKFVKEYFLRYTFRMDGRILNIPILEEKPGSICLEDPIYIYS